MTTGTLPVPVSQQDRVRLARATLARAEERTGARSVLPIGGRPDAPVALALVPAEPEPVVPAGILTTERPPMAVPPALVPLLPEGLRRGATTVVNGSTSLVLAVLAHACAGGAWAAVVGQPTVGLLAAAQAGVSLERLAVVPRPGLESPTVLAALLDGVDVVVVGPQVVLTDTDRRRLSARARDRGSVLLSTTDWPGASVVLTVQQGRWTGVDAGEGRLRTHEIRVARTGRGGAAVPQSLDLTLPLGVDAPVVVPAGEPTVGLRLVG
ncbi:hypothetical protein [Cellulomonas sp. URHD0024]|uniref:hypothetical protein n=1 Tax=Cellulomonas sp. URHD0024 TaxID=1302620 RepID=UPI0006864E05|nr:hypothetical protein [Cellulomonas sp. URHD0024]